MSGAKGSDHLSRGSGARPSLRNLRTGWIALATFLALIALSALLVAVFARSTRTAEELAREEVRWHVEDLITRTSPPFVRMLNS